MIITMTMTVLYWTLMNQILYDIMHDTIKNTVYEI